MVDDPETPWYETRPGLMGVGIVAVGVATLVILPYLNYVLLAVVLAYVLYPGQRALERYVSATVAASLLVVVAIVAILVPVGYLLAVAIREALEVLTAVQDGEFGLEDIEGRLEDTGYAVELEELIAAYREPITMGLQGLATSAIELVSGVPGVLIGLTVTLFVLFSLLRDGDRLVAWAQAIVPLEPRVNARLLAGLDELMWASVVGNVAVAAIQAILLGAGLLVLGVPAVAFLIVVTFVFALLPLIGAFGVWLPISIYLIATGQLVAGGVLIGYGSIVSASDIYLRPALIGRSAAFDPATMVLGIFGGIVVFGAVGLFVGPVALGGAKIALDVVADERKRGDDPLE
ncbi:AI-2E family transporter [Halovivax gelatinilyticus]|uniref:AI-2E family transporter n=1 Tax=Halovivax gelatinilyticus TaxID=2961597 RepID=UPI0031B86AD0